ncbi:PAS domain S-box protein [Methylovulum psychrotolerans]|nr:PAS domain S-box protein [Methylovulum psychrotolerans]
MLPDFLGQLPNGVAYGKILYQNGQAYDCAYFYTNPAFQRQSGLQDLSGQPDIFARYARVAAGGPPEHFQVFPDTFQAPYSVQVFSPKPEYFVCIVNTNPPPPTDSPSSPSARRYLCVLEDQTEIICRFLTDGTILYVNDAYCRFFGKSRESLIGKTWQPTAWAEDLPLINAKLAMLSPAQPVVTIENRLIAADGSLRWGQFVNRGFFDANGQLLEMQSVGRDITEQKQKGSRYFCERLLRHPCRSISKNHATAYAFGCPSRPGHSLATQQGVAHMLSNDSTRFRIACIFTSASLRENSGTIASGDYSTPVSQRWKRHCAKAKSVSAC